MVDIVCAGRRRRFRDGGSVAPFLRCEGHAAPTATSASPSLNLRHLRSSLAESILAMAVPTPPSKWQSLPTEQINPASLAVDKTPVPEIIDMVINEDRKVIA